MSDGTDFSELHERLRSKDRDEWIDEDGKDCLPVFVVSLTARKYHKRYDGCTDPSERRMGYDLFAAEYDGYEPCSQCFADDPYVDVGDGTADGKGTETDQSGGGR